MSHFQKDRPWRERQAVKHLPQFAAWFGLSGSEPQQGCLAQANSFFEASGDQAEVGLYCREMDGSGTCCGLSLAPRQFYQLRLNLSSWLLWITFAATPVCPCAPAAAQRPLLLLGRV